jgi:hypothetical protein
MKFLKTLGLAAAVSACLAFAGTGVASATNTVLCPTTLNDCSGEYFPAGTSIHAQLATGHVTLQTPEPITCKKSTLSAVTQTSTTPKIKISSLSFEECTPGPMRTLSGGEFQLHHEGGHNGNGTSSGLEVTVTQFGSSCAYGGAGLAGPTLKGGNPAQLLMELTVPKVAGGFLCPNSAKLAAHYGITSPKPLYVSTELF